MATKRTMRVLTGKRTKTIPFNLHYARLGKHDMVQVEAGKDTYWVDRQTKSGKPRLIKETKMSKASANRILKKMKP